MKREAAVAGVFYPDDKESLVRQVDNYIQEHKQQPQLLPVRALIVPHAGFVYSGYVAAEAYCQIANQSFDNVFLIGTSHKASYSGAVVPNASVFETPMGDVDVNTEILNELKSATMLITGNNEIHHEEHTLEVQLPFLQRILPNLKIVPILIGSKDANEIEQIAECLKAYFIPSNLFIISSDFSHYPPAQYAIDEDSRTARVICNNNPDDLIKYISYIEDGEVPNLFTRLCGWSSVLTLLYITQDIEVTYTRLSYQHSGMKLTKDHSRVVGYQAIAISDKRTIDILTKKEKKEMLRLAHEAINRQLYFQDDEDDKTQLQVKSSGVFVSVYNGDELRGCVGQFGNKGNLNNLIKKLAVDAAYDDSRFESIKEDELNDIRIEISLLTPLELIDDINKIEVGRHGIYIMNGFQHGTFLPQVGARNQWTVEEYLGHCSRDKAKIGWDGWREADIFIFEAVIIKDDKDG